MQTVKGVVERDWSISEWTYTLDLRFLILAERKPGKNLFLT